ncbi:hypothetical protein LCGC14_0367290 [marine sediment metagenome]|uniref:Uncharacterized protein n=1 Tax=marine sediment metagenome TaxID=412755 RepID=A0A0F9WEP5_9ZZZZ
MSEVEQFDVDQDEKDEEQEETFIAIEDAPEGEEQQDDEKDEKDDARLGGGREEDDEDKGKKSRREDGRTRRQRQRKAKERTDRELTFLRGRNETLERRFSELEANVDARVTGSELANVEQGISKSRSDLTIANQVIAKAIEEQKGADVAEAMEHRDNIRDNIRDLESAREYLTDEDNRRTGEVQPKLDPRHVAHAQSFMVDNDWWDPLGRDDDSRSVLRIDGLLVREGFDPTSKDYWDELRERVEKDLPHHFDAEDDEDDKDDDADTKGNKGKQRRSRGPTFRTGGRERSLKDNEVYISPERKDAMIEAGIWDDPVARNKMLKRYSEYDRDAAAQGSN